MKAGGVMRGLLVLAILAAVAAPALAAPADVVLQQRGRGALITDTKGMTLYFFERDDQPEKSTCVGPCAQQWPPLLAPADAKADGDWTTFARGDGAKQWAFRGQPLYRYSRDTQPGDDNGDGVLNQWRTAYVPIPMPPGFGIQRTLIGYVVTDNKSLTLYSRDGDKDGSGCDTACMRTWAPVLAPELAHPIADWTPVVRKNGAKQWAFRGKPLYRYAGDELVGDVMGTTVAKEWKAAILEPPPPTPKWASFRESDAGELIADAKGQTVYVLQENRRGRNGNADISALAEWTPVLADKAAEPVGSWGVLTREDGTRQWTYKGMMLFTFKKDEIPGSIMGIRSGDRRFQAIMRSGLQMQGTGN